MLDSALALRRKEGDIVRKNYNISNVSSLVKIKPKHANSKIKFLSRGIKSMTKYLRSLLAFSYVFFSCVFGKVISSFIKLGRLI